MTNLYKNVFQHIEPFFKEKKTHLGCFVQGGHRPLERLAGCGAAEDAGHLRRMRRPVRGPAPVGRRRHALGHRVRAFGRSGLPSQQSQRFLSLGFWSFLIVRPKVLAKPKQKLT